MSTCSYHPDKKATATCGNCGEPVCDRCRLNGTGGRCAACESMRAMGMDEDGKLPQRVHCTNHLDVPTDQSCSVCQRPYCPACINSGNICLDCALRASARTSASPRPRPSRPAGATPSRGTAKGGSAKAGGAKAGKAGPLKKKGGKKKKKQKSSLAPWIVTLGVLALVGILLMAMLARRRPAPVHVNGPHKVAIVSPGPGQTLQGNQVIQLKVASAPYIAHIELTVDGKYWDRLKKPPFRSDWQTALFKNGRHAIVVRAIYVDKRSAMAKVVVQTRNAKL